MLPQTEIDLNHYIFQALCACAGTLILLIGWLARGTFKRLDKIDDKLEPLKERISLTERDIETLRVNHDKLEQRHQKVHEEIFLKLEIHEKLISETKNTKK